MALQAKDITAILKKQIEEFEAPLEAIDVGSVIEVGDGIARADGLAGVMSMELVEFPPKPGRSMSIMGLAFNLEADNVGIIIMGEYTGIEEGDTVKGTGQIVSVPVGDGLMGRVVNALGQAIDGKGPISSSKSRPIERIAPNVVTRKSVDTPVQTGIKAIDSMIPIGRGQRELIIGDRQTGKTALAVDTIINQAETGVICIYVAIGQKRSTVAQVVKTLEDRDAMRHTCLLYTSDAADELT